MPRRFLLQTAAAAAYAPNGVVFDGTNDTLTKSSAYSGVADGKQVTFAFWIRLRTDVPASDQHVFSGAGANTANPGFVVGRTASNNLYVFACDTSVSFVIALDVTSTIALTPGSPYVVLGSFDMTSTASRHLYINDAAALGTPATYNNVNLKFAGSLQAIGGNWAGTGNRLNAELADLWVDYGRYVDFSIPANRRLFFSALNALVDKGANGQIPFGTAPDLFFAGPTATWNNNLGTGGPLTLVGALGTSSPPPVGA